MKINSIDIITALVIILLTVYFFVQSPMPLSKQDYLNENDRIPVNTLFKILAEENNQIRTQWTKKIVVQGKKVGLRFGEEWHTVQIDQGPLPALFLREVAAQLEKSPIALSLFLGSDFPINTANKFMGLQEIYFTKIKTTQQPQFFFDQDSQRYTAMFADKVVAKACASCHNQHSDSPKKDWQMQDIMGATTWSYPKAYVSTSELTRIVAILRAAFKKTYTSYLNKTKTFQNPPKIGTQWPDEGYFIPSTAVFMQSFKQSASLTTLEFMLQHNNPILSSQK
jgi:hypothetical protein